jgi:MFS transporter, FHS family, glucose/mannose:H+ symporter
MIYKKKQVFAAACIGLLLFGVVLITLGSILPALRDKFKIDDLIAGKLTLILAFGILIGSLVFGPVADRRGYKILLVITTLLVGLAFQGLAFAESWFLIQVSIFIIGFAGGIINGTTNAMVADISTGDKGANLSLLGVFFGIGALGMPLLLGILSKQFQYPVILSFTGLFMLLPVVYFIGIRFPVPKQSKGFPVKEGIMLIKEPILLLISFFLFFQSGTEALVNNWITTFLQAELKFTQENSLFILSCFVGGLTVSRLLLGFILKKLSSYNVMLASLLITAAGSILLFYASTFTVALIAMVIMGVGLAAGFPVMLGYAGQLYPNLSATAFSIALVIALIGNMLINYFFGFMSNKYGISRLPFCLLAGIACMFVLLLFIRSRISKIDNIK